MKETKKSPKTLFEMVANSNLPDWAKTTIALVSLALVPLLDAVFRLVAVRQLADLVQKLLGG